MAPIYPNNPWELGFWPFGLLLRLEMQRTFSYYLHMYVWYVRSTDTHIYFNYIYMYICLFICMYVTNTYNTIRKYVCRRVLYYIVHTRYPYSVLYVLYKLQGT